MASSTSSDFSEPATKRRKTEKWEPLGKETDGNKFWGPYLSERQWGTVREDLSSDGACWSYFPYEAAHERVYQSGEDGIFGITDKQSKFCISFAVWNGKDSHLKERLFGLSGPQGNHGEDVKEVYYYLDNTPDHSYMKALYRYPQTEFPYDILLQDNKARSCQELEFKLIDTGVLNDGKYWNIYVEYAKSRENPKQLWCRYTVQNVNQDDSATLKLLPQFWFRKCTDDKQEYENDSRKPQSSHIMQINDHTAQVTYDLGNFSVSFDINDQRPTLLFTDNKDDPCGESGGHGCKDAFHKFLILNDRAVVKSDKRGTKCGALFELCTPAGGSIEVYWVLSPEFSQTNLDLQAAKRIFDDRLEEANDFYDKLFPVSWNDEQRKIARQAYAGLLWSKQFYYYDIKQNKALLERKESPLDSVIAGKRSSLESEGAGCSQQLAHVDLLDSLANPVHIPQETCGGDTKNQLVEKDGRNKDWKHIHNHDIILMPDKWEFPWYAVWDLAFHVIPICRVDPDLAKQQLILILSDTYMHPSGQLPGCEFNFADTNPPLIPWACLHVYKKTGSSDTKFLKTCFHRLIFNFSWWINKKEDGSSGLFTGGFMGLDNISVLDRSAKIPGYTLLQADASGWMAHFSLCMLEMCVILAQNDPVYDDLALFFLNHFIRIAEAINTSIENGGLWHEDDCFYYDVLKGKTDRRPLCIRSLVGLIPVLAISRIKHTDLMNVTSLRDKLQALKETYPSYVLFSDDGDVILTQVPTERQKYIVSYLNNPDEFLSPFGIRSLSKFYDQNPYEFQLDKERILSLYYAPGESNTNMFGGNSNWRGPVWLCMNYMLMESLEARGKDFTILGSNMGDETFSKLAEDIARRIISIFLPDETGRRPLHGSVSLYDLPDWKDLVLFYEYFDADTGRGCGARRLTLSTVIRKPSVKVLSAEHQKQVIENINLEGDWHISEMVICKCELLVLLIRSGTWYRGKEETLKLAIMYMGCNGDAAVME
ncbi:hypothetical protein ACJMK2_012626 [Sinanodonta woodiana]|uniref:Mannosylglycerate hydrolase MGH1-like glycoside hydrolase domain-containing protein n=1 Tax=Sinanodonta woodiana TaxID=1069815 RepID=A0ABD3VBU8_SINWO